MLYGFAELFNAVVKTIADVMSKTPEEVTEWCEENDLPPCDLMMIINQLTREIRTERPYYDPREEFGVFVPYLAKNDFIYDENSGIFRER